jgi:hypothetical protein
MLMKVGKLKHIFLASMPVLALFMTLVTAIAPQNAQAAGQSYLFYFTKDDVTAIRNAIDTNALNDGPGALGATAVWAKDIAGNPKPLGFAYNESATNVQVTNNNRNTIVYTATYVCSDKKWADKAAGVGDYTITLNANVVIPKLPIDFSAQNTVSGQISFSGATKKITASGGGRAGGNQILDQDQNLSNVPAECLPSNLRNGPQSISLANFTKLADPATSWPDVKSSTQMSVDANADANACALTAAGCSPDSDSDTCTAPGGSGWFICMIITVEDATVTWIEEKVITPFLDTPRLSFADVSTNPQYKAWSAIRGIANVFFVLVFLIIIFANTFSLQSYNVKKTLPKLVAAVILVQLSYVLGALLIDATNVLSGGLRGLVGSIVPPITFGGHTLAAAGVTIGAGGLGAVALASHIASVGVISSLMPLFFGMLAVLFTLVLKSTIGTVLLITLPIAICAFVLPGTESFFKSHTKLFVRVQLMGPLIVLLFCAGHIAAFAAATTNSAMAPVMVMLCLGVPLLSTPFAFGWAGGIMSQAGKASFGGFKKVQGGVEKSGWNQGRLEERKRRATDQVIDGKPPKYLGKTGAVGARFNRMRAGISPFKTAGAEAALQRQHLKFQEGDEKAFNSQFDLATSHLGSTDKNQILAEMAAGNWGGTHKDIKKRFAERGGTRVAATKKLIQNRGYDQLAALRPSMSSASNPTNQRIWQAAMGSNFGDVMKAAPDVATGSFDGVFGDGVNDTGTINSESLSHLDGSTVNRFLGDVSHTSGGGSSARTRGLSRALKQAQAGKGKPINPKVLLAIRQNAHLFQGTDQVWVQQHIDAATGAFI